MSTETDNLTKLRSLRITRSSKSIAIAKRILAKNEVQIANHCTQDIATMNRVEQCLEEVVPYKDSIRTTYNKNSIVVKVRAMCNQPIKESLKPLKAYCKEHNVAIEVKPNRDVMFRLTKC